MNEGDVAARNPQQSSDDSSERQFLESVEEGLRDLEAGDVYDHAEVMAMMEERRQRRAAPGSQGIGGKEYAS